MAITKKLITINSGEKELTLFVNLVNSKVSLTSVYNNIFTGQRTRQVLKSAEHPFWQRNGFSPLEKVNASKQMTSSADIFTRLKELAR